MYWQLSLSLVLFSLLMATSSTQTQVEALAGSTGSPNNGEIPLLPPPDPDSNLPTIRLGETIRLEEMGPIILNSDGTTRRIDNWDNLSENEQKVAWRRISKRNQERRQELLQQQEELLKHEKQSSEKEKDEEL